MKSIKNIAVKVVPERLIRFYRGIGYGWHGNYSSWDEAKRKCTGYNYKLIIDKVTSSAWKIKDGTAAYERDSVLFDSIQYSYPVLTGLMWIAAQNEGELNVLDFGGALGSSYYQNKKFLDPLKEVNWCIVEQPDFVKVGLEHFASERLHFFYEIDECVKSFDINVILLSSVLQYLKEPYKLMEQIRSLKFDYIIVDRTPFIRGGDRITKQKVNPKIYKATYPCWFFNEEKFVSWLFADYVVILEFDALDKANISSKFKGFIFKRLNNKINCEVDPF